MKKEKDHPIEPKERLWDYVYENFSSVYREHTKILSSSCRQLALGEGGIVLTIKSSSYGQCISHQVNLILVMLVLFFLFDALQYLISSILYKNKAEQYNKEIINNKIKNLSRLTEQPALNKPGNVFFILKLFLLFVASIYLTFLIYQI